MITSFELHKLRVPAGRTIGDNGCAYDVFDVVVVQLRTADGLTGWGYGSTVSEGYFARTGWWISLMPGETQIRMAFGERVFPALRMLRPTEWLDHGLALDAGFSAVSLALKQAIWDLAGKRAGLPVWKLMAQLEQRVAISAHVPAYGSLLDFPLDDESTIRLIEYYLSLGLTWIKAKVGADDPDRDLRRLRLVSELAGPRVTLTADANEAWDAPTCIARMRYFAEHGIQLHYIEDPLPRTDLAGYRALRGQLPCLIAGHDYFDQISQFEDFIGAGVLDVVRSGANTSMQLPVAKLAVEHDLPVFYGNSIGEQNAHAAAGLRGTERIEFSWLAWSALFQDPIRVENGCMVAPDRPGFGLDPAPGLLRDFHNPGVAVRKAWPCPWERRRH